MTKNQILQLSAILGIMFSLVFFTPAFAVSTSKLDSKTEVSPKNMATINLIINRVIVIDATKTVNVDVEVGPSRSDIKKQKEIEKIRIRTFYSYRIDASATSGNSQVDGLIDHYTANNNISDKAYLIKKIVFCESRGDASAKNRYSTAGGLAQYLDSTWVNTPEGRRGLSKYDSNAAISAISRDVAQGYISKWDASRYCWSR